MAAMRSLCVRAQCWLWGACLSLSACSSGSEGTPEPEPGAIWVDIGLTSGDDGLDFAPLEPGGAVPLYTFGQGGTHALLAVRCSGLGNRAFVNVSITNLGTGDEVTAGATASPRLLLCRDEQQLVCDLLPLLVMTGGLVEPGTDRNGLPVRVKVDASNLAGDAASVERDAVLSTASL